MNSKKERFARLSKRSAVGAALALLIAGGGAKGLAAQGSPAADNAEQVLLQSQGAECGRARASPAIEREVDDGAEGHRGDGEGLRVPVQPGGRNACGAGGLGGRGKQVLPVLRFSH